MNALADMAARILNASDDIQLITSPGKKILKFAFILFTASVALLTFSTGFLMVITIPLLLFDAYFYYLFCKIWRSYRYSAIYLVLIPVLAIAASIYLKILFIV